MAKYVCYVQNLYLLSDGIYFQLDSVRRPQHPNNICYPGKIIYSKNHSNLLSLCAVGHGRLLHFQITKHILFTFSFPSKLLICGVMNTREGLNIISLLLQTFDPSEITLNIRMAGECSQNNLIYNIEIQQKSNAIYKNCLGRLQLCMGR